MKIFVDEHIPLMTVQELRMLGHDVHDIRGTPDEGMSDDALWEIAQREERLLITTDKGFTKYRTVPHYGVLIIRLRRPNRHKSTNALCKHCTNLPIRNGLVSW
jgi:predicted nuclease of predicted toxin-antitoxin system